MDIGTGIIDGAVILGVFYSSSVFFKIHKIDKQIKEQKNKLKIRPEMSARIARICLKINNHSKNMIVIEEKSMIHDFAMLEQIYSLELSEEYLTSLEVCANDIYYCFNLIQS